MVSWKVCVEVYSKFVCNFRKSTVIQLSFKWSLLNLELTFHWVCYLQKNFMIISFIIPLKSAIYFKGQLTVTYESFSVVFCYVVLGIWVRKYKSWVVSGDVIEKCLPLKSVIYFKDQLIVIFDSLCVVFCYIFLGIWVRKYKSWEVSGDVIEKCLKWSKQPYLSLLVIKNILILTSVIDNLINCHLHMIVSFFDAARREWIILGSNGEMPSHP